jgi:hypothetical protein
MAKVKSTTSNSTKGKQMTALEKKIAERMEAKAKTKLAQSELLANNDLYVDYLTDKQIESNTLTYLDAVINQINGMKTIVAQDGTKFPVHCYPVAESIFGVIGSRLLAIASIAGAMFTSERQAEFTALTGIDYLIALDAYHKLGRPAYFSKQMVLVESTPFQEGYQIPLIAIASSLNVDINEAKFITDEKLSTYFSASLRKAKTKEIEYNKTPKIEEDSEFTMEDN